MREATSNTITKATEAEQLAQIMAKAITKLPAQAQFGFFQQIIGAATLTQMMQEQEPA